MPPTKAVSRPGRPPSSIFGPLAFWDAGFCADGVAVGPVLAAGFAAVFCPALATAGPLLPAFVAGPSDGCATLAGFGPTADVVGGLVLGPLTVVLGLPFAVACGPEDTAGPLSESSPASPFAPAGPFPGTCESPLVGPAPEPVTPGVAGPLTDVPVPPTEFGPPFTAGPFDDTFGPAGPFGVGVLPGGPTEGATGSPPPGAGARVGQCRVGAAV
ncbi:hypothetical protein [Kibdelosporangium philippinense]|uniref:hypothetical protein n=1 Tax=Kibdelosporangium philippinense TaxID=211113 RepID=UPI00361F42DE